MFSIILPVGNSESTIIESINSVLNQTEKNFELLIGLNNISDQTEKKILNMKVDKRVRIYKLGDVGGISNVLNFLIEESSYEYIVRHDSDDYMYRHRLMILKQIFEQDMKVDITGTAYTINQRFTDKFKSIDEMNWENLNSKRNSKEINRKLKMELILSTPYCHPTIAFKKATIKKVYDEEYKYAQDLKFLIDNIKSCRYFYSNIPTIDYTSTSENLSPYKFKRQKQLMLHDRAICSLHKRLLGNEYNAKKSILCRIRYVTSDVGNKNGPYDGLIKEYSKEEIASYYNKLCAKMEEIIQEIK